MKTMSERSGTGRAPREGFEPHLTNECPVGPSKFYNNFNQNDYSISLGGGESVLCKAYDLTATLCKGAHRYYNAVLNQVSLMTLSALNRFNCGLIGHVFVLGVRGCEKNLQMPFSAMNLASFLWKLHRFLS